MRKQSILMVAMSVIAAVALMTGCAATPSEKNFKDPTISLSHVEVPYYVGYYYISSKVKPTKGDAGNYGAPMMMAFIFDITNNADYPVQLDGFKFSVLFEDFEVNTVSSPETMWIPAGMTNQLRVPATFDTRQTLLTLLLPGAMQLKEKGLSPWEALEKWWTGAPDFAYTVGVSEGAAVFKAGDLVRVVPFETAFP
jgi:hypothetical protein